MLLWTLLAILIAAHQAGLDAPKEIAPALAPALLVYLASVYIAGRLSTTLSLKGFLRSLKDDGQALSHRLARRMFFVKAWTLLGYAVLCYGFGWRSIGASAGALTGGIALGEIVNLLPFLAGITILLWTWHPLDAELRGSGMRRAQFVVFVLRHEVAVALAPLVVLLIITEIPEKLFPDSPGMAQALSLALALGFMIVAGPGLLRRVWRTRPMPDCALKQSIVALCSKTGLRCRDVLIWETGKADYANAAVVGFVGRYRYILLSDGLLARLEPDEIAAVCGHEMGHIARRHMIFYMVFALGFAVYLAMFWTALAHVWPGVPPLDDFAGGADGLLQGGLFLAFSAFYWGLLFGGFSRRIEREADMYAAGVVGDYELCARALEKLGEVNRIGRYADSWRHYSIARRAGCLRMAGRDPRLAAIYSQVVISLLAAHVLGAALGVAWLFDGFGVGG
ncbi:MAG TPA: M48 family metallopeptidase [Candidatus Brocadiia bacterium]|nr:M48 family metallopeptidase [Candidatus Brocadiia bacterium]